MTQSFIAATALLCLPFQAPALADGYIGYEVYSISTDVNDWSVYKSRAGVNDPPFENTDFAGRDDVLKLTLDPPKVNSDALYRRWEGYRQATNLPDGAAMLKASLYIPESWRTGSTGNSRMGANFDFENTGLWGNGDGDDGDGLAILHFGNQGTYYYDNDLGGFQEVTGTGRFNVWDPNKKPAHISGIFNGLRLYVDKDGSIGWSGLPETASLIEYDDWNDLEIRLMQEERRVEYFLNGQKIFVWQSDNPDFVFPASLSQLHLVVRNEGNTQTPHYESHWSDLSAGRLLKSEVAIGDATGPIVIDPDERSAREARVADGATLGDDLTSKGGTEGVTIDFLGAVTIEGDVKADNTALRFTGEPSKDVRLEGDLTLVKSRAEGGSPDNPIRVNPEGTPGKGVVRVDAKSRFDGHWSIRGSLYADGRLSPGSAAHPIGVIDVDAVGRTSMFDVHTVYEVDLIGDRSDLLRTSGALRLANMVFVRPAQDNFLLGHRYTIIEAAQGFRGSTFDRMEPLRWPSEIARRYPFLFPRVSNDETKAYVSIERNPRTLGEVAATDNQRAVADAIDDLGMGHAVHDTTVMKTFKGAEEALAALSGEIHASAKAQLMDEARLLRGAISERLARSDPSPHSQQRNVWVQALAARGETDVDDFAAVEYDTQGIVVGADGRLGGFMAESGSRLGFALGASRSDVDLSDLDSSVEAESLHLALYGSLPVDKVVLRAGTGLSWHGIESERRFADGKALDADYDASTWQLFGEVGYPLAVKGVATELFAGVAYVRHSTDGFAESGHAPDAFGGEAAALRADDADDDVVLSVLGVRVAKSVVVADGVNLNARGEIGWRHAFGEGQPESSLAFTGGQPFAVRGNLVGDSAVVGLGAEVDWKDGMGDMPTRLGIAYNGDFSKESTGHQVKLSLSVDF